LAIQREMIGICYLGQDERKILWRNTLQRPQNIIAIIGSEVYYN